MRMIPGMILALVAGLGLTTMALAQTFNLEHEHVPGELIVKFDEAAKAQKISVLKSLGAATVHQFKSNAELIRFADKAAGDELLAKAKQLAATPGVKYVEANTILRTSATYPNDARFSELYGMHNEGGTGGTTDADIDAPEAWDLTTGSRDILVGIIDTGVDYTHPDIAANYWNNPGETGLDADGNDKTTNGIDDDGNGYIDDFQGWDFVNDDNDPMDDNNHGTHCAGTIGGVGNDGAGVAGVNWEVSMVGIKFLSGGGSGSLDDAVKAIEYATTLGVHLSSNSWGGGGFSDTMDAAIRDAEAADILFLAAAGNSSANNDSNPHYPSSYEGDNIIAVAATDHDDGMASFSCYGLTSVDVGAPGVDILSSVAGGDYDTYSGTSMATPHTAGLAALIWSMYPDATAAQVKSRIMNTVDPVASLEGRTVTGGRINAFNALENDSIPPGEARNIAVVDTGLTTVDLEWAPAGDDGDVGEARRYEIRYAAEEVTDANWADATKVSVTVRSAAEGRLAGQLTGFSFNASGFIAMRATDNVGNVGVVSASVPFSVKEVMKLHENNADSMDGTTADEPWGLEEVSEQAGTAFSDSPAGEYANDLDISMTLDPIAVDSTDVTLVINTAYDLESGYDFGFFEISSDGTNWAELEKFSGTQAWTAKQYDLSSVLDAGATSFTLRFRLTTDYSVTRNGLQVDDIVVFVPR